MKLLATGLSYEQENKGLKDLQTYTNKLLIIISPLWDHLYYLNDQEEKLQHLTQFLFIISSSLRKSLAQQ